MFVYCKYLLTNIALWPCQSVSLTIYFWHCFGKINYILYSSFFISLGEASTPIFVHVSRQATVSSPVLTNHSYLYLYVINLMIYVIHRHCTFLFFSNDFDTSTSTIFIFYPLDRWNCSGLFLVATLAHCCSSLLNLIGI